MSRAIHLPPFPMSHCTRTSHTHTRSTAMYVSVCEMCLPMRPTINPVHLDN